MRVGAILTIAGGRQASDETSKQARERQHLHRGLHGSSYVLADVLGESLLNRTTRKVQTITTLPVQVISEGPSSSQVLPVRGGKSSTFLSLWEKAVSRFMQESVDLILLVRMSTYNDLSYGDLIEYHLQKNAPLTQVYAEDGALDIGVVSASALKESDKAHRRTLNSLIAQQERYSYTGYVNRLGSPQDFHNLVQDALYARCGLTPLGRDSGDGVWIGEGAEVDSSAHIVGPAYVGEKSRIGASCVIKGASAVERDCQIDCGTTISQSCVLENTYVGVALDVRRSIVSNDRLFQLDRNIEVSIGDRRLIGSRNKSAPFFSSLGSLLFGEARSGD